MIPRNELLELLEQCAESEAQALSLYTQYSQDPLFLAGLPPQESDRTARILQFLKQQSAVYAATFRELSQMIGDEEVQDVF